GARSRPSGPRMIPKTRAPRIVPSMDASLVGRATSASNTHIVVPRTPREQTCATRSVAARSPTEALVLHHRERYEHNRDGGRPYDRCREGMLLDPIAALDGGRVEQLPDRPGRRRNGIPR